MQAADSAKSKTLPKIHEGLAASLNAISSRIESKFYRIG